MGFHMLLTCLALWQSFLWTKSNLSEESLLKFLNDLKSSQSSRTISLRFLWKVTEAAELGRKLDQVRRWLTKTMSLKCRPDIETVMMSLRITLTTKLKSIRKDWAHPRIENIQFHTSILGQLENTISWNSLASKTKIGIWILLVVARLDLLIENQLVLNTRILILHQDQWEEETKKVTKKPIIWCQDHLPESGWNQEKWASRQNVRNRSTKKINQ